MWKKVIILWKEKHWRAGKHCKLRAAAIHRLGKLCGVGFTFYTPVNSDFHEVGGVATATVVSHHFCCLCHRDHLILF